MPSSPRTGHSLQAPQRLSGSKDVQFFAVGNSSGRTLVVYMRKENVGGSRTKLTFFDLESSFSSIACSESSNRTLKR